MVLEGRRPSLRRLDNVVRAGGDSDGGIVEGLRQADVGDRDATQRWNCPTDEHVPVVDDRGRLVLDADLHVISRALGRVRDFRRGVGVPGNVTQISGLRHC